MPITKQPAKTPVSVGTIRIIIEDINPNIPMMEGFAAQDNIQYSLWLHYDDGSVQHLQGNLAPHLSGAQINAAVAFAAAIRQLAEQILLT